MENFPGSARYDAEHWANVVKNKTFEKQLTRKIRFKLGTNPQRTPMANQLYPNIFKQTSGRSLKVHFLLSKNRPQFFSFYFIS